jgi:outer membrane immunogenic protein
MTKIRTHLLATAAVVALSSAAYAADMGMPLKAPPPPAPPPFSWTGFYVGIAGGAGWGTVENNFNSITLNESCSSCGDGPGGTHSSSTESINTPWGQTEMNGWLFGGTVGYNWQANPWLVLGAEGDFDWTDIEGTSACGFENVFGCHAKVDWTADIAGRIGFTWDRALIYAKGGVAWAHTDYNTFFNLEPDESFNISMGDTRVGGLFGAGIEYAFLPNWSAKIEYNFMDFGTKTFNPNVFSECGPGGGDCESVTANVSLREVIQTVKFGVNYRFWGY